MTSCHCGTACNCPHDYHELYLTPEGTVLREFHNVWCPKSHEHLRYVHGQRGYWVSWWTTEEMGVFELHSPWWISGELGDGTTVSLCAAVRALSARDAKALILCSYERLPGQIEWRFVEQKADGWSPFSDRFPRAEWMQW